MFYLYGTKSDKIIEAKDIDFAIKKIKMTELYPENQATPKPFKVEGDGFPTKHDNYIDYPDFREIEFHDLDESLVDRSFVPLYEGNTESLEDDGEGQEFWRIIDGRKYYFHKVHDIPLRDLLSVNYNSLLLECKTDAVSTNEIAVVQKQEYVSSDERRIRIQQINEQMAEMHKVKMQLEEELKEMNQWVEAKGDCECKVYEVEKPETEGERFLNAEECNKLSVHLIKKHFGGTIVQAGEKK